VSLFPDGQGDGRSPSGQALLTLVGVAVLSACGGDAMVVSGGHPVADSVGFNLAATHVVDATFPEGAPESLAARLAGHRVRSSIGAAGDDGDTPDSEVFGRIVDVAFVGEDRVAVLDQIAGRVEVFGLDGGNVGGFGGLGEGPGELDFPISLLVPNPREIQVLDAAGRVHRFVDHGDDEWSFEERMDLTGFPRDACVNGGDGQTVLHVPAVAPGAEGVVEQGVLRVHDRAGAQVRAFGTPYRHSQRLVADRMRRGRVACAANGYLVLALEGSNRVAAWRVDDGSETWNALLDGIEVPRLLEVELPGGRPGVGQDFRGNPRFHSLTAAEPVSDEFILLQYQRFRWYEDDDAAQFEAVESWIIEAATGEGGPIGEGLPRVGAVRDSVIVFLYSDPFPRIEIASW
jgi:hypothetical protein